MAGWGGCSHSNHLLDELWGQLRIFWLEGKESTVSHLSMKSPYFFFLFLSFLDKYQLIKWQTRFDLVCWKWAWLWIPCLFIFHWILLLWICSHWTDSCRFFNTFTLLFQGPQILRFPSQRANICSLGLLYFHSSCGLNFNLIFWDHAHLLKGNKNSQ